MRPSTLSQLVRRLATGAIALALAAAAFPALASTAANTQIRNVATVNYKDAGGVAQEAVTAFVTVTVSLVPSKAKLTSPPNDAIAQGTSATLIYTITATANGPDTYNLTSSSVAANLSTVTPAFPASVDLGGTTLAADAANGATALVVPYDNDLFGAAGVNKIVKDDTIVLNDKPYVVLSITKNPGANTATINLTSGLLGAATAGQIIGEQQNFTLTEPSGTVASGSQGTQTVNTTAKSLADSNLSVTQATPTVITVNRPMLTVQKLVSVDGGGSFGTSGVAPPGTSLVYKIVAKNTGITAASAVAFSDVLPKYLTYVSGQAKVASSVSTTYAAATALGEGSGGYSYTDATRTVAYDPASASAGGLVDAGGELVLFFRATIND